MNLAPLRALALDLNLSAHGVDVTVTVDSEPIVTRGIWLTPTTEALPGGMGVQRHEPIRIMALRRDDVPTVPRGTLIEAPIRTGDPVQRWTVDSIERVEADQTRVVVIAAPDEAT